MDRLTPSRRWLLLYGCLLFSGAYQAFLLGQESSANEGIQEGIRQQLELTASSALQAEVFRFYRLRNFAPGWTAPADAEALLSRLSRASEEGLNTPDYSVQELRALVADRKQKETGIPVADVRLTVAYMTYSRDVRGGRVSPETLDGLWTPTQRQRDLADELSEALRTSSIDSSLRRAVPAQASYRRIKEALAELRSLGNGRGWTAIAPVGIEAGTPEQLQSLRERLTVLGDLLPDQPEATDEVRAALIRFQRRHGVGETGEVDQSTARALNVPLEKRIRTIEVNMERWRWLPDDLGSRHILVNIAAFEVQVVESGRTILRIPTIVGRPYRRTPVFSGLMTYLVFSPYWNVPNNIAVRDKLPLIQENPDYLARQGFRVFLKGDSDLAELDPETIDWGAVTANDFPYRLRQDPGPLNALGGVKFMFPNRYNVYLHDTPQRELFGESVRTFSSGCIRLERPFDLAQYLLRGLDEWTDEKIREAMNAGRETTVVLPDALPIHVVYLTAWVGEDGELNFRDDIYGRDALLLEALYRSGNAAAGAPPVP
jgi:murein L,D-transpeptidase YcbB/YkuD